MSYPSITRPTATSGGALLEQLRARLYDPLNGLGVRVDRQSSLAFDRAHAGVHLVEFSSAILGLRGVPLWVAYRSMMAVLIRSGGTRDVTPMDRSRSFHRRTYAHL